MIRRYVIQIESDQFETVPEYDSCTGCCFYKSMDFKTNPCTNTATLPNGIRAVMVCNSNRSIFKPVLKDVQKIG